MSNKKFLKKCQKAFKDKDLILFNGLYPFNHLIERGGLNLTREQLRFCDLLLLTEFPFVIEHKIESKHNNHFYCDVLVKGKYNFVSFEIDGGHHYTKKQQKIRDIKKALFLLENHKILTVRVRNERILEYRQNPYVVNSAINLLYIKQYNLFNKTLFFSEKLGELKEKMREVKSGKYKK